MNRGMPPSRGARNERRGNPFLLGAVCGLGARSGDADSHDQFENWSRNDRGILVRSLFSLLLQIPLRRPLRHFVPLPLEGAALRGKGFALAH